MNDSEVAAALRVLISAFAECVVLKLSDGAEQWIDQHASQLGARRHCAAVRRRIGNGSGGAAVVGRRHMLTPDAMAQELAAPSKRAGKAKSKPLSRDTTDDFESQLRRKLRLVGGNL